MALVAPIGKPVDLGASVQSNQQRANGLMQAAWAQMSKPHMQAQAEALQAAATNNETARAGVARAEHFTSSPGRNYHRDMSIWGQSEQGASAPGRSTRETIGAFGTASPSDRDLLAKTLQAEAGGEGEMGMLAAGSVIANRVASGNYGNGWNGVIMKPGQFSAWNGVTGYAGGEGALDMDRLTPSEVAYSVADRLLGGQYEDPTGGATHYYNPAVATPKWGRTHEGDQNWQTIGNHIFGFADAGRNR